MSRIAECLKGKFTPHELNRYVIRVAGIFWGLILVCRILYPKENHYSIMTHTFSFLGSFDPNHNPRFYWLFTFAMVFWALAIIPLTLYLHRRFSMISRWAVWPGTFLFFFGALGMFLVGIFPDAHGKVFGEIRHTDIHQPVALMCFVGYGLGIPWFGLLLVKDRIVSLVRGAPTIFDHRRVAPPFLIFLVIYSIALYFQIKWEYVYAAMKKEAAEKGLSIGSHWTAALNTIYSFPLWENVLIYTMFAFIMWLCLVVPKETTPPRPRVSS